MVELDLEEGDITGTWDVAHQLQLIWNKSIKSHPRIENMIKLYFDAMGDFSLGKSSTIFMNRARELGNLVLTPKKQQTTRFVRSLVRGLRSAMQNLPTMIAIFAEEYQEVALEGRNDRAKEYKKKLEDLRSSKNFLYILGLLQLLEVYSEVSLDAQHMKFFPTQVWSSIKKAQEKVEVLSKQWIWSGEKMTFSVMEEPRTIVETLLSGSRFEPKLLEKNVTRKGQELREAGLLEEGEKVSSLFDNDKQIKSLAGEAYMKEIDNAELKSVEKELSKLAETISKDWKRRQTQSKLEEAASEVLGQEPPDVNIENDDSNTEMMEKLTNLIDELPQHQKDKFDPVEILPGLLGYKQFTRDLQGVPENDNYSTWYKKFVKPHNSKECNIKLSKLFENLQVRSSSEAIAETVGSIMTNHVGKGRYLNPHNFSKEICLEYNLGPQVS